MIVQKKSIAKFWVIFILITLSVSPAFALGDGNKNLFLVVLMCFSPVLLLTYRDRIPKIDIPLLLLCFMMIFFPGILHSETMRWSTVIYSCMFCLYFMTYVRVLRYSLYSVNDFTNLLKWLLYAYCIVLMIQQFCVLMNIPIFNVSNYEVNEPWKLNSLMSEPSHSARIISTLMYMFISLRMKVIDGYSFKKSFKIDKKVWLAFLWASLTMGSSTIFLFLIIVFAKFLSKKRFFASAILLFVMVSLTVLFSENKALKRTIDITKSTVTLEESKIIQTDMSAAFRIVPSIMGFKFIGYTTKNDWLGYGVDADQKLIPSMPTVDIGNAGSFYMWVNYGLIVALLVWIFTFRICYLKEDWISILVWFLCIFMYGGLNNQIIWLTMALFYTYKVVKKNLN